MTQRFGSNLRLRRRTEFKAVEGGGRRVAGRFVILIAQPNGQPVHRLGLVASRRVGGAVVRNRAKRRLREVFRRRMPAGDLRGLDIVAIAKADIVRAPFDAVATDFLAALSKLRGAR
jgi:ribonuclease P protein component